MRRFGRIRGLFTKPSRNGGSSADANDNIPMAVAVPADDCLDIPVAEAVAVPMVPTAPDSCRLSEEYILQEHLYKQGAEGELKSIIERLKLESNLINSKMLVQILKKNISHLIQDYDEFSIQLTEYSINKEKSEVFDIPIIRVGQRLREFNRDNKELEKLINNVIARPEDFHITDRADNIANLICEVMDTRVKIFGTDFEKSTPKSVYKSSSDVRRSFRKYDRLIKSLRNRQLQSALAGGSTISAGESKESELVDRLDAQLKALKEGVAAQSGEIDKASRGVVQHTGSTLSAGESKVSNQDIKTLIGLQKLEPVLELQKYLVDLIKKFTDLHSKRISQNSFNERLEQIFQDRFKKIIDDVSNPSHIEELIVLVRQKPAFCCTGPFLEKIVNLKSSWEAIQIELNNESSHSRWSEPAVFHELYMGLINAYNNYFTLFSELKTQLEGHNKVTQHAGRLTLFDNASAAPKATANLDNNKEPTDAGCIIS